ncbi:MAG: crotonase, partial [Gammaproteobacteria bacterium]|nr:crotonase [Gammaproteobacteria bacterium]
MKSQKGLRDFKPQNVQVIGAGIMGGDIASWCVLQGMTVGLQDREPKFIAPAIKRAHTFYKRKLKHPRLVRNTMDRLIPDIASYNTSHADVVI